MKKNLFVSLLLVLALVVTACSGGGEPTPAPAPTETPEAPGETPAEGIEASISVQVESTWLEY